MANPPGNESELSSVSRRSAANGPTSTPSPDSEDAHLIGATSAPFLSGAAIGRLADVAAKERRQGQDRRRRVAWSDRLVDGVVCGLHLPDRTYTAGLGLAAVDRAARRAAACLDLLNEGQEMRDWPRPSHPTYGGLRTSYARAGSLDVVLDTYGHLTTLATSQPVAIAALFSLTLDAFGLLRWGSGLRIRHVTKEVLDQPPVPVPELEPAAGAPWSAQDTKTALPVILEAIQNGRGVEFVCGDVRIIVSPAAD